MKSDKLLLFIIILIGCLAQFASDIYTASVPFIAKSLYTHIDMVQYSMAVFLFGVGISLLIYGVLSEAFGRKKPLLIGLTINLVGCIICWCAHDITTLMFGRLIQGIGAGAAVVLWRTIFRDAFSAEQLAKYSSYLVVIIMFIVPAAPALGGFLQHWFGWRASFAFLSLYTIVAIVCVKLLYKETKLDSEKERVSVSNTVKTYGSLLTNKLFFPVTLATFLTYGAFFSWFTVGPVLLIHVVGLTPVEFGLFCFFGGGIAYGSAGIINGKVVKRFGMTTMMRFGWSVMLLAGVLLLLTQWLFGVTAWGVMIPIILLYFGSTFIWPNAFAQAMTPFGKTAGYAGAAYAFMQWCGGALLGAFVAYLPDVNQIPLALVIVFSAIIAWCVYERSGVRHRLESP